MQKTFILLLSIGLASCATPEKAVVIAENPEKKPEPKEVAPIAPSPEPSTAAPLALDDGLRMPDMLQLPDEERLRSSAPAPGNRAPVIIRPPSN